MLDKFLVLLERFVVAHELIAENSKRPEALPVQTIPMGTEAKPCGKDTPVEGEDVIDTKPKKTRAKAKPVQEPEEDLADDEEPAPKKTRTKKGPDLGELRDEIKTIAKHIAEGDDDECADKFDELLDAYKVRTVTKLSDDDVADFHADAKALVAMYYEIED